VFGISILPSLTELIFDKLISFSLVLFLEFPSTKNEINHKLMKAIIENNKTFIIDFSEGNKTINNIVTGNNITE
jgi:hypothetical protein